MLKIKKLSNRSRYRVLLLLITVVLLFTVTILPDSLEKSDEKIPAASADESTKHSSDASSPQLKPENARNTNKKTTGKTPESSDAIFSQSILETAKKNPLKALETLRSKKVVNSAELPVLEEKSYTGSLIVISSHSRNTNKDEMEHVFLQTSPNTRMQLLAANIDKTYSKYDEIRVSGFNIGSFLITDMKTGVETDELSLSMSPPALTGVQRVVGLPVYFSGNPGNPGTSLPDTPTALLNTTVNDNVNDLYTESSYGKTSIVSTTMDWWQSSRRLSCNLQDNSLLTLAQEAIDHYDSSVDFRQSPHVIVFSPYEQSCTWAGLGTIGTFTTNTLYSPIHTDDGSFDMSISWINIDDPLLYVTSHELGHNFGLEHSNLALCNPNVLKSKIANCSFVEYGSKSSMMGSGSYDGVSFNAEEKRRLGWIDGRITATKNGIYTLKSLSSTSGRAVLRIPRSSGSQEPNYLTVEYRTNDGYDTNLPQAYKSGVLVYVSSDGSPTYLLDATPGTPRSSPALPVGKAFLDPLSGTTVRLLKTNSVSATISIQGCMCINVSKVRPSTNFTAKNTLVSPNRRYEAVITPAGKMQIIKDGKTVLWKKEFSVPISRMILFPGGNLALFDSNSHALWTTDTGGVGGATSVQLDNSGKLKVFSGNRVVWTSKDGWRADRLYAGEDIQARRLLISPNKKHKLDLKETGSLKLYTNNQAVWSTNTSNAGRGTRLKVFADGNIAIFDIAGKVRWQSHTIGQKGKIILRIDRLGRLHILKNNRSIWSRS